MPEEHKEPRDVSLARARQLWLQLHEIILDEFIPLLEVQFKAVEELKVTTTCEVNKSPELQKCILMASFLQQGATAAYNALRGAYMLFNQCHQADVLIRETKAGIAVEETMINLRGIAGDNASNAAFIEKEIQTRELVTEGDKRCAALRKQADVALEPARSMTLKELDDYKNWVQSKRPDLLGPENTMAYDLLMPEADA